MCGAGGSSSRSTLCLRQSGAVGHCPRASCVTGALLDGLSLRGACAAQAAPLERRCGAVSPSQSMFAGSHDASLLAGLFAVEHSAVFARLILDRRLANLGESRLRWITLPLGSMFRRLKLLLDKVVRGHGSDLSIFLSQLREHPSGHNRNCFGRESESSQVAQCGGQAGVPYVLTMT